jgi:PPOX class probable F420-dependent enzyme
VTPEECLEFAAHGRRTAKVAIVLPDGRPHVTPVWFVVDDGRIAFTTQVSAVKGRVLRDGSPVAVTVDSEADPVGFVAVRGHVQREDDPAAVEPVLRAVDERYGVAGHFSEVGEGELRRVLFRVVPDTVTGALFG